MQRKNLQPLHYILSGLFAFAAAAPLATTALSGQHAAAPMVTEAVSIITLPRYEEVIAHLPVHDSEDLAHLGTLLFR